MGVGVLHPYKNWTKSLRQSYNLSQTPTTIQIFQAKKNNIFPLLESSLFVCHVLPWRRTGSLMKIYMHWLPMSKRVGKRERHTKKGKQKPNNFRVKCVFLVLTIACIDHKLLTKNWKILTAIQSIPSEENICWLCCCSFIFSVSSKTNIAQCTHIWW